MDANGFGFVLDSLTDKLEQTSPPIVGALAVELLGQVRTAIDDEERLTGEELAQPFLSSLRLAGESEDKLHSDLFMLMVTCTASVNMLLSLSGTIRPPRDVTQAECNGAADMTVLVLSAYMAGLRYASTLHALPSV